MKLHTKILSGITIQTKTAPKTWQGKTFLFYFFSFSTFPLYPYFFQVFSALASLRKH